MPELKGINTEECPQLALQQCVCPAEKTHTDSITSNDDIDTCTMEEARILNFCRTDSGGASQLQHKIV